MNKPLATILLSLIIISNIQFVLPKSWNGFELIELDWDQTFSSDTDNWGSSTPVANPKYTQCTDSTYLLGGQSVLAPAAGSHTGAYFSRSIYNLPSHSMIRFSFTFYAIDNWSNYKFQVQIDNRIFDGMTLTRSAATFPSTVCGTAGVSDAPNLYVFGSFTHQVNSVSPTTPVTISIISRITTSSNTASFGIRDFKVIFDNNPLPLPPIAPESMWSMGTAYGGITYWNCLKTQYYTGSACADCHIYCDSCWGGGATRCMACKSGYSWNGYECMPCHSSCDTCIGPSSAECSRCVKGKTMLASVAPTSVIVYGSCFADCPYPLTKSTTNGLDYCARPNTPTTPTPSTCTGKYLYWDKSCSNTCAFPLRTQKILDGGEYLCIYPCSPGEYLYWDGTCQSDCPSPFTTSTVTTSFAASTAQKYYRCDPPVTCADYISPTGTCLTNCNAPMIKKTIQGQKLCVSPCQRSTDYLYWNSECLSTCDTAVYTTSTTYGVNFCEYSCTGTNYKFWESTCLGTCDPPLIQKTDKGKLFCVYPTPTANFLYWDGTSETTCALPLDSRTESPSTPSTATKERKYCDYPCDVWEYLRFDGTCLLHCNFPFKRRLTKGRRFCDSPCTGTNSLFWDGTCRATSTCIAPVLPSTIGTAPLSKDICSFPAGDVTQFLYWDGSFHKTCPLPYTTRIESTLLADGTTMIRNFCEHPCNGATSVLGWDGVCSAGCATPGTQITYLTKQVCQFPCSLPQFLNYDGNCIDECKHPWIQDVQGAGQYCRHPCFPNFDYYYNWDSTCTANCEAPLVSSTMDNLLWCVYPCEGSNFLYRNGTCLEFCEPPFVSRVGNGMNYCENPCSFNEALFWNTSCYPVTQCMPYPMKVVSTDMGNICQIPCASPLEFFDEATRTCVTECDSDSRRDMGLYLLCKTPIPVDTTTLLDMFLNAPNSTVPTLVRSIRVLEYIRYVDIKYPPRLQRMLTTKGSAILTMRYGKNMSSSLKESFPYYDIPDVFEKYKLHSNFIVNFWREMVSWMIILAIIMGLLAIQEICQRNNLEKVLPIVEKLVVVWKWNSMLIFIGKSIPDIILYSSLQFRTVHFSSKFVGISLEFAVLMIGVIAMLFTGVVYLANGLVKAKETQSDEKQGEYFDKWKGYQTLFRGYTDEKSFNSRFYLIYLFRISVPMFIASYLFMAPILQTLLYFVISILMTLYVLWARPVMKTINFIQLLTMETIMLVVNLCLFLMTALSQGGDTGSYSYILLGDFVVGGNSVINLLFIVCFLLKITGAILRAIRRHKAGESWLKGDWVEVFAIYLAQVGFGFEDISPDPKSDFNMYNRLLITEKGVTAKDRAEEAYKKKSRLGVERKEEEKKKPGFLKKLKDALFKPPEESNLKPFTEVINFEAPNRLNRVVESRPETPISETVTLESERIETDPNQEEAVNRFGSLRRRTTMLQDKPDVLTIKDMLPPPKVVERQWTPNIGKKVEEDEDREKNVLAYLARKGVFAEEEAHELMVGRVPKKRQTKRETQMFYNPNMLGVTSADVRKVDLRNIADDDNPENPAADE